MTLPDVGMRIWTYRRQFTVDGLACQLEYRAGLRAMASVLTIADIEHGWDCTPVSGEGSVRNHLIKAALPNGRQLEVEAGFYNWLDVAVAVRLDGTLVHESHPGRAIELPERARRMMIQQTAAGEPAVDMEKLKANRIPIMVDVSLGIMFFVIGKYIGLTEAALSGAAAGLILLAVQRATRIDLLGGLASFGIVMMLLSAAFAWFFQDEQWVKQRSTVMGLIAATAFLTDGALGGRWLGRGLSRYVAYRDIVPARLSLSLGCVGLVMAGANWLVATLVSTEIWLFYTTFVDIFLAMVLAFAAIEWSRQRSTRGAGPPAAS